MLTARDIERKEFSRTRTTGYNMEEVDAFRDDIVSLVSDLQEEKERLSAKALSLSDKLEHIRDEQESWKKALINTQKDYDEVLADARKKADEIVQKAKEDASAIRERAQSEAASAVHELENLKREKNALSAEIDAFKASLVSTYEKHIQLIRDIPVLEKEDVSPATEVSAPVPDPVAEKAEPIAEKPAEIPTPAAIEDSPTIVIPKIQVDDEISSIEKKIGYTDPEAFYIPEKEEKANTDSPSKAETEQEFLKSVIEEKKNNKQDLHFRKIDEDDDEDAGDADDFDDEESEKPEPKDRESVLKDLFAGTFSSRKKDADSKKKRGGFFSRHTDDDDDDFDDDDDDDDDFDDDDEE